MEIKKAPIYDNNKNIFQCIKYSKAKEIVTALKRTPRRDVYANQEKVKIYSTLTKRFFGGNIENREELSQFVDETLADLNDVKRESHTNEKGFLKGTLDEDGNTWHHTKGQRKIGQTFGKIDMEEGKFSEKDYELLLAAFDFHDIGEGPRGDVVYDHKNNNNELFERKCGEIVIDNLIKDEWKTEDNNKYINEAYDINFNKDHHLHPFFKTYEIFSYIKGAMIATHNDEIDYPHRLVHNVLINQIKKLPELKTMIPSAKFFIKEYATEIDGLFTFVEQSDFFENGIPEGKSKEEYIDLFIKAKSIRETVK
ncbi:hypothetical protein P148_SR1C00001G0730 [candidate division SR1 bacterium RAAC1_SR1_1]|nr:hypothetical protein P148_SR1C00001G0730 [candidate division SR1 bacterium RAAC1_SR1_1]